MGGIELLILRISTLTQLHDHEEYYKWCFDVTFMQWLIWALYILKYQRIVLIGFPGLWARPKAS